ncbi:MAG: hypothetical protein D3916_17430 [Candidatus Electrothrix sp. MAN1_4]|nr:hypothetical protein [Candidatus Electrothrix sp. MAN1_4]
MNSSDCQKIQQILSNKFVSLCYFQVWSRRAGGNAFDYTKWREEQDEEGSIEEISKKAMALRKK